MSDYCSNAEVVADYPTLVYASTSTDGITSGQVDTWISEFTNYINGRISNRYAIPITGTASLIIIKMICKDLVVSKIKSKLAMNAGSGKMESQLKESQALLKNAEDRLTAISNEETDLIDAPSANVPTTASYGQANDKCPVFDYDKQQW